MRIQLTQTHNDGNCSLQIRGAREVIPTDPGGVIIHAALADVPGIEYGEGGVDLKLVRAEALLVPEKFLDLIQRKQESGQSVEDALSTILSEYFGR